MNRNVKVKFISFGNYLLYVYIRELNVVTQNRILSSISTFLSETNFASLL